MGLNKTLLIAIAVAFVSGVGVTSLKYEKDITDYKLEAERSRNELLDKTERFNRERREAVRQVEETFLKNLENQRVKYEKIIADLNDNFSPNSVFDCSRDGQCVPRTSDSTSQFVCYRRADLRTKIEKTVALGHEADELALKYNALNKIIKGE